jgi:hypothetical protein
MKYSASLLALVSRDIRLVLVVKHKEVWAAYGTTILPYQLMRRAFRVDEWTIRSITWSLAQNCKNPGNRPELKFLESRELQHVKDVRTNFYTKK